MEAAFGNMLANREEENLRKKFGMYEFVSFGIITFLFTCAGVLIVPFVTVYTHGIDDADYIRPVFAYLLVLAYAVYAIRAPYNNLTLAAGHYRQTRNGAFAEAAINIVTSSVLVFFFGIVGVAAGTLAAMTFRTLQYVFYLSKNILRRSVGIFFKRAAVCALCAAVSIVIIHFIPFSAVSTYAQWALLAVIRSAVAGTVTLSLNFLLCKREFIDCAKYIYNAFLKKILKKS